MSVFNLAGARRSAMTAKPREITLSASSSSRNWAAGRAPAFASGVGAGDCALRLLATYDPSLAATSEPPKEHDVPESE